jgi:hypothetical protein
MSSLSRIFSQMAASSGYKPNLMFDEVRDFSVSPPVFKHQFVYLNNFSVKNWLLSISPPPHFLNGLDI